MGWVVKAGCKLCRKPHPEDPLGRVWLGRRLYPVTLPTKYGDETVQETYWTDRPCECVTGVFKEATK